MIGRLFDGLKLDHELHSSNTCRAVAFRVSKASAHRMVAERSEYFHTLNIDASKRYAAETSSIGNVDPYSLKQGDRALQRYYSTAFSQVGLRLTVTN